MLKKYLRELLSSFIKTSETRKQVSAQSFPASQWQDIDLNATSYTASANWWIKFNFHVIEPDEYAWFMATIRKGISLNLAPIYGTNAYSQAFIPIKKGDTIDVKTYKCSVSLFQFFPAVGEV